MKKLNEIFSLPCTELYNRGKNGRQFILTYKSNIVQAGRIIEFMNKNA